MASRALKTVEKAADEQIIADAKMRIWNAVSRTDPTQTKTFKRAGGFSGTAVKPIWVVKRLTEQFGPCGEGWGIGEPSFEIVHGDNKEVLVYCTVACWHTAPANKLYGVGGDKVVTHIKANPQYNRPERWENDDEAFKKAFTDAVNNAFKFVGVAADIHMGQFDDSKYVNELRKEFEESRKEADNDSDKRREKTKLDGPYDTLPKLEKGAREFARTLRGIGSLADFEEWKQDKEVIAFVDQCKRDLPGWWFPNHPDCPPDFTPLAVEVASIRRGLAEIEELETNR